MTTKLFTNSRCYTPVDPGHPLSGDEQKAVRFIPGCAILTEGGTIKAVGTREEMETSLRNQPVDLEIDCENRCLIPGFVDPHTHLC